MTNNEFIVLKTKIIGNKELQLVTKEHVKHRSGWLRVLTNGKVTTSADRVLGLTTAKALFDIFGGLK